MLGHATAVRRSHVPEIPSDRARRDLQPELQEQFIRDPLLAPGRVRSCPGRPESAGPTGTSTAGRRLFGIMRTRYSPAKTSHRFVLHDRDGIYAAGVDLAIASMGRRVLKTPVRAPQANAFCQRLIGTMRRECLDWLIPLTRTTSPTRSAGMGDSLVRGETVSPSFRSGSSAIRSSSQLFRPFLRMTPWKRALARLALLCFLRSLVRAATCEISVTGHLRLDLQRWESLQSSCCPEGSVIA